MLNFIFVSVKNLAIVGNKIRNRSSGAKIQREEFDFVKRYNVNTNIISSILSQMIQAYHGDWHIYDNCVGSSALIGRGTYSATQFFVSRPHVLQRSYEIAELQKVYECSEDK